MNEWQDMERFPNRIQKISCVINPLLDFQVSMAEWKELWFRVGSMYCVTLTQSLPSLVFSVLVTNEQSVTNEQLKYFK